MLKRNLVANYLGQGWTALMGLAFIPLYIKYLGIEAYGVVGLFATLQACLGLLDMGLTPALGREMARFTGGGHSAQSIRDILRSVEAVVSAMLVVIILVGALVSGWVARHWLSAETIPIEVLTQALVTMTFVIALRLFEGIYRSTIVGLQQQVLLNLVSCFLATLRWLGAVVVLAWYSPTLQAFFIWQGISSLVSIVMLAWMSYRLIPAGERQAKVSWEKLRSLWSFAGGMVMISLLTLLLTQVDKILLSRLLMLGDFGYYVLASSVASGLYTLITPISLAYYPRFCEWLTRHDETALIEAYHEAAQLMSVIAGSAALVVLVFADDLMRLWTQNEAVAVSAAPLLSILILGNLLNGLMWIPYQAQLAHGWTRLSVYTNSVAILFVVPAFFLITPIYGAIGAAWVWVALNAGYFFISANFMYRRILSTEKWRWYVWDVLSPLLPTYTLLLALKKLLPSATTDWSLFFNLAAAATSALLVSGLCAKRVRTGTLRVLRKIIHLKFTH